MPTIYIYGHAYGVTAPINITINYYIYSSAFYFANAICAGGFKPDIYLFKYTQDDIDYVAVGLKATPS